MIALLKPKYYMPIHGEFRHLYANKEIAEFMGIPSENIFISEIGKVLEIDKKSAKFSGTVPAGNVMIDGSGVGDIGSVVLRDRKHLAEDGLVVIVAAIDTRGGYLVSGPDIISRGFVYVKESEGLVEGAKAVSEKVINNHLSRKVCDWAQIKGALRDEVSRYIYKETKRKPMILPVIMNV
jgi:ribonuclease J